MRSSLALVALLIAAALVPAPAQAHSTLVDTEPPRDAVVERSPDRILLRFDEPVETALGSIRVYDGDGEQVDDERIGKPRPEEVTVAIGEELARGTYTVAWRAISADSDPISGAWVFHVQAPGDQPSGIAAEVLEGTADRGRAAVANQLYNTLIRAIEQERKLRELGELAERLEALEEVLKGRKTG
jgi:copper transport protein